MYLFKVSFLLMVSLYEFIEAVYVVNELSFGQKNKIASENGAIANFNLLGLPNPPEVLSNKIILTPPTPGNSRGALWSDKTLSQKYWKVDVELRASGPERAGGNIQIWYVKDGQQTVGTSSIYTVGKFDGLALTIDQYAGSGGSIRAFLNDGTTNFKSHHNVDSLAFGNCDYSYRNLGRPSRISFSQIDSGFHVVVDGRDCLASSKIILPPGNSLGITAAGAELPDSVEIFKLVTTIESPVNEKTQYESASQTNQQETSDSNTQNKSEEKPNSTPQNSAEQSADLNIRLQAIMKQINRLQQALSTYQTQITSKQDDVSERLRVLETRIKSIDSFSEQLLEVKKEVSYMKDEIHKSLDQHVQGLKSDVKDTHKTLINTTSSLHNRMSGLGSFTKFIFLIIGSQVALVSGYIIYKRRKGNMPKKFI